MCGWGMWAPVCPIFPYGCPFNHCPSPVTLALRGCVKSQGPVSPFHRVSLLTSDSSSLVLRVARRPEHTGSGLHPADRSQSKFITAGPASHRNHHGSFPTHVSEQPRWKLNLRHLLASLFLLAPGLSQSQPQIPTGLAPPGLDSPSVPHSLTTEQEETGQAGRPGGGSSCPHSGLRSHSGRL